MADWSHDHKIYMVTGKGGVGKSAVSAALAEALSRQNKRVLLVEIGSKSYFSHVYDLPIHEEPTQIKPGLDVVRWTGESCLRELFGHILKVRKIVDLFFDNRVMKALVSVAPALKELAILGKLTSGVRGFGPPVPYDVLVLDGFASGHFLNLLKVPWGISEVIKKGPMSEQSLDMQKVLLDSELCKILLVTLPEELPITESLELKQQLKELGFSSQTIVNEILDTGLTEAELAQSQSELGSDKNMKDFYQYVMAKTKRQAEFIVRAGADALKLPLVFSGKNKKVIHNLVDHLEDQWKR